MPVSKVSEQSRPGSETSPQSGSGEGPGSGPDFVALDRSPGFWMIVSYAVLFGVVLALVALAFLALVKGDTKLWFTLPKKPGWFSGSLWWVAVTAGAGVLVGVLRRVLRLPGGPFLVMLFIGGTSGIAAHVLIPGLLEGLAFATMFAALPGSLVAAPFSLIVLAALTTQIGTVQIAPVAIAVLTAYLAVSGSGALMALQRNRHKARPVCPQAVRQPSPSASCR